MSELKVWSLNCGRLVGSTPEKVAPVLRWLKCLSGPGAELPDVLCLQDFRVSCLQYLWPLPHFHFAPMTNHLIWGKRELVGIVVASRFPIDLVEIDHTWGDGMVRDLKGVGLDNQRTKPDKEADRLVLQTENRVAIAATVRKAGPPWRVATTHGFWVRGGVPTPEQLASTELLSAFLVRQSESYDNCIAAADWNFDKDGQALSIVATNGGRDWLPGSVKSTLPPRRFKSRPDRPITWGKRYTVEDISLDFSPGSDHGMLKATVVRPY